MGGHAEIVGHTVWADDAVLNHVLQKVDTDYVPTWIDAVFML
jgi:hypothetical protein